MRRARSRSKTPNPSDGTGIVEYFKPMPPKNSKRGIQERLDLEKARVGARSAYSRERIIVDPNADERRRSRSRTPNRMVPNLNPSQHKMILRDRSRSKVDCLRDESRSTTPEAIIPKKPLRTIRARGRSRTPVQSSSASSQNRSYVGMESASINEKSKRTAALNSKATGKGTSLSQQQTRASTSASSSKSTGKRQRMDSDEEPNELIKLANEMRDHSVLMTEKLESVNKIQEKLCEKVDHLARFIILTANKKA